jgi:membrane-bound lytic murein transglycosylase B
MDGDDRRDLWSSLPDVIGSVANYLHRHGWEAGEPVAVPATVSPAADLSLVAKRDFKAQTTLAELAAAGFSTAVRVDGAAGAGTLATVVRLEEEEGDSYWLTFGNFYVITRYNRSPLYAMAVFELSEAIRAGFEQ